MGRAFSIALCPNAHDAQRANTQILPNNTAGSIQACWAKTMFRSFGGNTYDKHVKVYFGRWSWREYALFMSRRKMHRLKGLGQSQVHWIDDHFY